MKRELFSICIPNFNYANYIGITIESVLKQTYKNFEIVIVDNASTDESVRVIKSFRDKRIRLFQNRYNVGFAPNLDRTAQRALNPYLIMLSSDDIIRPTALEEYQNVIRRMGSESDRMLLVSSIDIIDSQGNYYSRMDRKDYYQIPVNKEFTQKLKDPDIEVFDGLQVFRAVYPKMSVPGHFCTTLYSKKLYESLGGYSSIHPIGPDAHLDYKALLQNVKVVFVNRPLFGYRIHNTNQISQSRGSRNINVLINCYQFSIQYPKNELERAGVKQDKMPKYLVDSICLKGGFLELANGSSSQAFRYLMFAFASYPKLSFINCKTYGLFILIMMGPIGKLFCRITYKYYNNLKRNN